MCDLELPAPLRLDPWAASSLLQKAIRRGEAGLASRAGLMLFRQRGIGVFKRLCTIAVEDIGIANVGLVHQVTRMAANKQMRAAINSDACLIDDLCGEMARAVKDRSADYLYSVATKTQAALHARAELLSAPLEQQIEIATDATAPLIRRAVATLMACAPHRPTGEHIVPQRVEQLLEAFEPTPEPLHGSVMSLAKMGSHPFCVLLPLIWSAWQREGSKSKVEERDLPHAEVCEGIPLYIFDLHTAAGKHANATFARQNGPIRKLLSEYVPPAMWTDVVGTTAFYVDATPVLRRLAWSAGSRFAQEGFRADMFAAGSSPQGAGPIRDCVKNNLDVLNRYRRAAFRGRAASLEK